MWLLITISEPSMNKYVNRQLSSFLLYCIKYTYTVTPYSLRAALPYCTLLSCMLIVPCVHILCIQSLYFYRVDSDNFRLRKFYLRHFILVDYSEQSQRVKNKVPSRIYIKIQEIKKDLSIFPWLLEDRGPGKLNDNYLKHYSLYSPSYRWTFGPP